MTTNKMTAYGMIAVIAAIMLYYGAKLLLAG